MSASQRSNITTEICIDSVEGVIAAQKAGAQRVELCSALLEGGLTPSFGMVVRALEVAGNVGVQVMIRPRGGDFCYTAEEFNAMKADIIALKTLGVAGVVFGLLDENGNLDAQRTAELVELARPASVTFHRAIDMARDPFEVLDQLVELGVERILTSGQAPSVLEGAPVIRQLNARANGRIKIMPGGDITASNVKRIIEETGAEEIHFAALEQEAGPMRHHNRRVFMGGALRTPEYDRTITRTSGIRNVLDAI